MSTHKEVWVAYKQGEGFIMRSGGTTEKIARARVFTNEGYLKSSLGRAVREGHVIPVPVKLVIDPEVLLILKLGGKPLYE